MEILCSEEDYSKLGVYKIMNCVNDYIYIGSTNSFRNRVALHKHDCKRNRANRNIKSFVDEYGWDNLKFDILEIVEDVSLLKIREDEWMSTTTEPLWNTAPSALGNTGTKMPESHKKRSSERMMGNALTKGVKYPKEFGEKIAKFWEDNPDRMQEMKDKNRESQKKVDRSGWSRGKIIEVYYNGELIDTVYSLKAVCSKYDIGGSGASEVLNGKKKSIKGYTLKSIGKFFMDKNALKKS